MAKQNSLNEKKIANRIAKIIQATEDVSRLVDSGITESFTKSVLGRNSSTKGIKISLDNNKITVNLYVIVKFGANIPQLSYDIQSRIKNELESIQDLPVIAINVNVEGIDDNED